MDMALVCPFLLLLLARHLLLFVEEGPGGAAGLQN